MSRRQSSVFLLLGEGLLLLVLEAHHTGLFVAKTKADMHGSFLAGRMILLCGKACTYSIIYL